MKNILVILILLVSCNSNITPKILQQGVPGEVLTTGIPGDCKIVKIKGCDYLQSEFEMTNGTINHLYQHMHSCSNIH